jgi:hypothetical protein
MVTYEGSEESQLKNRDVTAEESVRYEPPENGHEKRNSHEIVHYVCRLFNICKLECSNDIGD